MPLENAQFIDQLNPAWPLGSDGVNTSDDHHRNTKTAVQQSFPNIDKAVTATSDDLNTLTGAATVGSGLNPVGTVLQGAWSAAPNGYLPCDGSAIDPGFTALTALLGKAFTPDLRGEFIRGWSDDALVDPDGPRVALDAQDDEFKAHTHTEIGIGPGNLLDAGNNADEQSQNTGSTGGAETRPRNIALMFVIKW